MTQQRSIIAITFAMAVATTAYAGIPDLTLEDSDSMAQGCRTLSARFSDVAVLEGGAVGADTCEFRGSRSASTTSGCSSPRSSIAPQKLAVVDKFSFCMSGFNVSTVSVSKGGLSGTITGSGGCKTLTVNSSAANAAQYNHLPDHSLAYRGVKFKASAWVKYKVTARHETTATWTGPGWTRVIGLYSSKDRLR